MCGFRLTTGRQAHPIVYSMPSDLSAGITLVLVVRNEEAGIRASLPRLPLERFEGCFAIDGNSSDATPQLLRDAGIAVHAQCQRGLGAAMLEARELVKTNAFIFFHPDGNEDPGDLPRMVDLLRDGSQFVVASRMIPGAWNEEDHQRFRPRKWANCGLALLANVLFARNGNRTTDVTNGFRGITCAAWDRMQLTSQDLTMDYQMVIRALKCGIPITEFPTHESQRIGGQSAFSSLPTGIAELKLLWREIRGGWRIPKAVGKEQVQLRGS
jgi:glycosyltransferase involved in cell wall biosynthesis